MLRKLLWTAVLMLMVGSLVFAAGVQETPAPAAAPVAAPAVAEKQVLRITGLSWQIQKIYIQEAAKAFMADHPNVTIEISTYAEPSVVSNYAIDWARGKTPVDIAIVSGAQLAAQFVPKDLIYDFDKDLKFFSGNFSKEAFVGAGLENGQVAGKQVVLPLIIETYAVVINKPMFKEAGLVDAAGNPLVPKTWEEFYQFAKKLHKVKDGAVVQQGATMQWSSVNFYATLLAVLRGSRGTIYAKDGVSLDFNNAEFREILKVWKKGVDEGVFSKEMYVDNMAGRNSLMAGKLAMLFDAGGRFIEGGQTLGVENVTVIPFPGADTKGSFGFGAGVIIPKSSPVPELAMQFIKEQLLGKMVQTGTVNVYGKMPAILEHYNGATAPEWQVLKAIANKSGAIPTYKDFSRFQKEAPPILQNYLDGKLSLEDAITALDKLVASLDKSLI